MSTQEQEPESTDLTNEQIIRLGEHRYLQRRFYRANKLLSIAAQIDAQQGDALTALLYMLTAGIEPTVGNLALQMCVEPHTCTYLLNKLEEKELITRERLFDGNFSKKHVSFTEEGQRKAQALTRATFGTFETFVPLLIQSLENTWATMHPEQGEQNEVKKP